MIALVRPRARLPVGLPAPAAMPMTDGGESSRPAQAPPGAGAPARGAAPADPEDDDSDRGTPRLGPALVFGVVAWGLLMWLVL